MALPYSALTPWRKRWELLGVKNASSHLYEEQEHVTHRPAPPRAPLQPNAHLQSHGPTYTFCSLLEMPLLPLGSTLVKGVQEHPSHLTARCATA